jgi:hypothetical protein
MDRGYLGDVGRSKPPGSAAVGPLQCAGYRIWSTRETGGGNWPCKQEVCGLLYCEDEEALLAVQCVLYLHPKPSMTTTPPPPGRLRTAIHDLQE